MLTIAALVFGLTGQVIVHDGAFKLVDRTCRLELLRYAPAGESGHVNVTLDCTGIFKDGME